MPLVTISTISSTPHSSQVAMQTMPSSTTAGLTMAEVTCRVDSRYTEVRTNRHHIMVTSRAANMPAAVTTCLGWAAVVTIMISRISQGVPMVREITGA